MASTTRLPACRESVKKVSRNRWQGEHIYEQLLEEFTPLNHAMYAESVTENDYSQNETVTKSYSMIVPMVNIRIVGMRVEHGWMMVRMTMGLSWLVVRAMLMQVVFVMDMTMIVG